MATNENTENRTEQLPVQLEIGFPENRPDRIVAQHNDLIRAQYDMSLLEMRLFIAMLARINRGDKEFSTYRIPVSELYPEDKVGGKTYSQIKKAVIRLSGRTITVESKDERGIREIVSNPIMSTCRYKEKSGHVMAQFNNFVKPYLLELRGDFSVAQELTLIEFRSFYSFRVYWLLKLSAFHSDTIDVGLAEMKHMFHLTGKYTNFADFKRFVLDVSQQEIATTDMAFEYKPIKDGKSVVSIQFQLLRPVVVARIDTELPDGVQQKLTELGISLKSLHDIKDRYRQGKLAEEYIRFVLIYYEQAQTKGRIRSLAGAIYKALMTNQLVNELEAVKAAQPTYKAPQPKAATDEIGEDVIALDELRSGWEAMRKQGLSDYETFEASLTPYRTMPNYRFERRNGVDCLIYTRSGVL
ncbi:MAG: replication initiation protein [Rudanella sp.]|nr:replication initiation protein [Rudanella sp.]